MQVTGEGVIVQTKSSKECQARVFVPSQYFPSRDHQDELSAWLPRDPNSQIHQSQPSPGQLQPEGRAQLMWTGISKVAVFFQKLELNQQLKVAACPHVSPPLMRLHRASIALASEPLGPQTAWVGTLGPSRLSPRPGGATCACVPHLHVGLPGPASEIPTAAAKPPRFWAGLILLHF